MKFSTRTLYGLKAILVLASRHGEGSMAVSQIAKKEGISIPYLEQILNALKKKGFVKSVRGPQGGYILSKKPSEITLKDLFYCLEGSSETPLKDGRTGVAESDEVGLANLIFWKKLQQSIDQGLEESTLKDLIDEARTHKKNRSNPKHTFHI